MGDLCRVAQTRPRPGNRFQLCVAGMIGLSAAVLLSRGMDVTTAGTMNSNVAMIIIVFTISATLIGYYVSGWIGSSRPRGWLQAFLTYCFTTIVAGAIGIWVLTLAGELYLVGYGLGNLVFGLIAAPFFVFMCLASGDFTWPLSFILIQLIATRLPRYKRAVDPDIVKRFE